MDAIRAKRVVLSSLNILMQEQDLDEEIQDDTPLFSGGLLDSMAMIRLVSMLERELDITMSPGEVSMDSLDTVAGIVGAVDRSSSGG